MRSIGLIKGLLKRFDLLSQFFALLSLHLKASMYIFYLGRLCHEACRWSVEDERIVVDGDCHAPKFLFWDVK
jgi:hypothetical protein